MDTTIVNCLRCRLAIVTAVVRDVLTNTISQADLVLRFSHALASESPGGYGASVFTHLLVDSSPMFVAL